MANAPGNSGGNPAVLVALIGALGVVGAAYINANSGKSSEQSQPELNANVPTFVNDNSMSGTDAPIEAAANAVDAPLIEDPVVAPEPVAPEPAPAADEAPVPGRQVYFRNTCNKPIKIWLRYHTPRGWESGNGSHWRFDANKATLVSLEDGNNIIVDSSDIYFYAAADDGSALYWSGNYPVTISGKQYSMVKAMVTEDNGNYSFGINCDTPSN